MSTSEYTLEIELLSDATFGSGEGVAGAVDAEIQHDECGLPTISGRAIKGLLVTECAELLQVLPKSGEGDWRVAALRLFGQRGETIDQEGNLTIGTATVAPDLAAWVRYDVGRGELSHEDVLNSLTAVRCQTADAKSGAPQDETLRSIRVIIRGLKLYAPLFLEGSPTDSGKESERALLAACVMSWRRAGLSRTRGRGWLEAKITQTPLDPNRFAAWDHTTPQWFEPFKREQEARA